MSTIKHLQRLKLEKVQPHLLQKTVKGLLIDFDESPDQKAFEEIAKDNIIKIYDFVKKSSPEAIPTEPEEKETSKTKPKEKSKKKVSKTIKKELADLDKDIKACRTKIRAYNKEKRENEPKKPKPKRSSRIKNHFISIGNLIPEKFKENLEVQKEAEKVLLRAYRGIMDAYRINKVAVKEGEQAIKDKYDKIEETITK